MTIAREKYDAILADGLKNGDIFGGQLAVFDKDSVLYNEVTGLDQTAWPGNPGNIPFLHPEPASERKWTKETVIWVASCTKLTISILVLQLLEKKIGGLGLEDMDDHEKLEKVLPEFKIGSGSLVSKIITGYKEEKDKDGKKVMILKDRTKPVTLRHLLTHTAGLAYYWNHPLMVEAFNPAPESGYAPNFNLAFATGAIADFTTPAVCEAGEEYRYSPSTDWLGQYIVRATGKNLQQVYREMLWEPLGLGPDEIDINILGKLKDRSCRFHGRMPDGNGFVHIGLPVAGFEGEPPAGYAHFASACVYTTIDGYVKVLQAVLRQDEKLLRKSTWQDAMKDQLPKIGAKAPIPSVPSFWPMLSFNVDQFLLNTKRKAYGINLFQAHVDLDTGAFAWAGLANTYFKLYPAKAVGHIITTQLLPWYDPRVVALNQRLEAAVQAEFGV